MSGWNEIVALVQADALDVVVWGFEGFDAQVWIDI